MTTLNYKALSPGVTAPEYKTDGASGMDLASAVPHMFVICPGEIVAVSTGLALEIPPDYEGQVRTRSGMAMKGLIVANSPGTVDSDYRGEVKVILANIGDQSQAIQPGDRIAQLVIAPVERVTLVRVDELSATERGSGGFGSTGR